MLTHFIDINSDEEDEDDEEDDEQDGSAVVIGDESEEDQGMFKIHFPSFWFPVVS